MGADTWQHCPFCGKTKEIEKLEDEIKEAEATGDILVKDLRKMTIKLRKMKEENEETVAVYYEIGIREERLWVSLNASCKECKRTWKIEAEAKPRGEQS